MSVESLFLETAVEKLQEYVERIGFCLGKLDDDQLWARGQKNENAIGNLLLHLNGNVRQWIIGSLGGRAESRDRDSEFAARGGFGRKELISQLRTTVDVASAIMAQLTTEQLTRIYPIQRYEVSGVEAVFHVVEHFSQHTGQIIFATKMLTGTNLAFYAELDVKP